MNAPVVEIVHFADPWCWWSWGLEPVLQRLREVYGDDVTVAAGPHVFSFEDARGNSSTGRDGPARIT